MSIEIPTKDELENLYWDNRLNQREISEVYKVWDACVSGWMKQYDIPVRSLSERNQKIVDLTMNERMAYILGIMFGDGGVFYNRKWRTYQVVLNTVSKPFAESFKSSLKEIGLAPCLWIVKRANGRHKQQYRVNASSKMFVDWFRKIDIQSVENLLHQSLSFTITFLRGFYESEGTYSKDCCFLSNRNKELVNLVSKLLLKIGIEHRIYFHKRNNGTDILIYINKRFSPKFLSLIQPVIKKP